MADDGIYVYGIVRAGHPVPPRLRGVGSPRGPSPRSSRGGWPRSSARRRSDLRARRRDLLAHQELLLALAADGPVLPMRFGMVAPDEAAVRRQLAGRARSSHLAVLERVDGRVEINVKAMPADDSLAALRQGGPHDPPAARGGAQAAERTRRMCGWGRPWPPRCRAGRPKRGTGSCASWQPRARTRSPPGRRSRGAW